MITSRDSSISGANGVVDGEWFGRRLSGQAGASHFSNRAPWGDFRGAEFIPLTGAPTLPVRSGRPARGDWGNAADSRRRARFRTVPKAGASSRSPNAVASCCALGLMRREACGVRQLAGAFDACEQASCGDTPVVGAEITGHRAPLARRVEVRVHSGCD